MANFPFLRQLDAMDCGPTCLQMIAKYYGRHFLLKKLRDQSNITREGVSMLGISEAAESVGFRTVCVKITLQKLREEVPLPCIVHWQQRHFAVVHKIKNRKIHVADPGIGSVMYTEEDFKKGWLSTLEGGNAQGLALLLEPSSEFYQSDDISENRRNSIAYLFSHLRQYRKLIFQLLLGLFCGSLIQLALPFLTQSIVDKGIHTNNVRFIYLVLLGQVMLFISRLAIDIIRRWILLHLSTRINVNIVSDFLIKLFKLPLPFFEGKMIGDILRRVEDHSRIEKFLSSSSLTVIFSFFTLIVFSFVLMVYSFTVFLVFVGFSAVYIAYTLLFLKRRAKLDYLRFQELAGNQNNLIQIVQGMNEIKMNNAEMKHRWKWEHIQAKLFKVSTSSMRLQQYQEVGSSGLNELKNIIITVITALAVMEGQMTLGMMLAVQYIIGQLNTPLNDFILFTREWQDAKLSLERIGEIHSLANEDSQSNEVDLEKLIPQSKSINIENLSFQYEGIHTAKVLDKINLIIPEGKITAIVGVSGSGKTTLMKLLLKFYQPTEGSIVLGKSIVASAKETSDIMNAKSWRQCCGAVMQDGFIFADSISNNIALNGDQIDKYRLLEAARTANCIDFIDSLPLGFNTQVGINGIGLSQGQKQRLLIARAIYKDPEFIFLDEATSSLDANNERSIMDNLNTFFASRTVVVIAHRLSTVKNADQIVVLDKGKIAELGTHEELTKSRGLYFQLVKNQLELGN